MQIEIDEDQRSEILWGLLTRRTDLEKLVKDGQTKHAPNKSAEKLLRLYGDGEAIDRTKGSRKLVPGLLAIFAAQPELSTEATKGQTRDNSDGQQDAFGGGVEVGAGTPAGQREWLDTRGNPHASEAEAEAADAAQAELDAAGESGVGSEPAEPTDDLQAHRLRRLALASGQEGEEVIGVPIDSAAEDVAPVALGEATGDGYDAMGRCIECRVFRFEVHDATCSVGIRESLVNAGVSPEAIAAAEQLGRERAAALDVEDPAAEATRRQQEELAQMARDARPSGAPPRAPDYSTSAPTGDSL